MSLKMDEKEGDVTTTPTAGSVVAESSNAIDPVLQKRVMLKLDAVVLGCFGIMYLMANLDRNNLGNTNIMGLPEDLGLKGNEFGNAVTLFFATYVAFEAPCSIALKVVGPKNLLSVCMLGWGVTCLGMGFITNVQQLYACRLIIGAFEAGLIPCINAYIGMVYLRNEMSLRSAIMYGFSALAGAVGGLLASAVSNINAGGLPSWSWLFIIEGIITIACVPVLFTIFPKDPRTAWFLNEQEREVMRLRFELNPHLSLEDKFSWAKVFSAFKDPKLYLHAVLEFCVSLSLFSFMTFLPAVIRGLGYASVKAQLLTVPVYLWATVAYIGIALASDRIGLRSPFIIGACLALITGYSMMLASTTIGVRLAAVFCLGTGVYARNFAGHFKRATALGIVYSVGNSSGIVVGQIFTTSSAPRYLKGVRINTAFASFGIVLVILHVLALRHVNAKRRERLATQLPVVVEQPNVGFSDYDDTFRYNL
ncbi:high-affinity nicotinic acid transporter [Verticillium alfalfae VaMs.102]|uniref:High-affinity nicotinic acid transporter n=1 Tax=Verticillium alfalfae (strain VaMs.102 / ATCC MYA-4576 / FGSC 10136) TaxID=526221 RepID=C9S7S7_VERA1|nr:high-affinity nicotinic acid transporter [Verticillium alfalfae VaMs.102]EEY14812.1 high-affinity nicotinic acid transporter [Verticillium alfalfae VaMs.102]